MGADRWSPHERDRAVLGVLVHGPAIVARSPGIAIAVRCVFARPDGLEFDLVLRAVGVQAEAATRQTFGEHARSPRQSDGAGQAWPEHSEPELTVEVDGERTTNCLYEQSNSGGDEEFTSESRFATSGLPSDGQMTLIASWPQAGLAEAAVTLTLAPLDNLANRVVRLSS